MIILKPYTKETIWGGERLKNYYGADTSVQRIGSLYTAACLKEYSNEVEYADGFKEKTFYELFMGHKEQFGFDYFPFLIAFVDAAENLSIQVHPTDHEAINKGYLSGKSESWWFIEPPEAGFIYNGAATLKQEDFETAVVTRDFSKAVSQLKVEKNDYVFVPAGTVHALTAGSLVYEIQEPTDVTYRFYDYERADSSGKQRILQEEEALEAVDITKNSQAAQPFVAEASYQHAKYTVTMIQRVSTYANETNYAQVLTVLNPQLVLGGQLVHKGQSVIVLPQEKIKIEGELKAILAQR